MKDRTPLDHINDALLERSRQLLRRGFDKVEKVALRLGMVTNGQVNFWGKHPSTDRRLDSYFDDMLHFRFQKGLKGLTRDLTRQQLFGVGRNIKDKHLK
jgi:hypothetical protein